MNIFVLDSNPNKAAEYHNDIHVRKMLVESCQLLCTAHHILGTEKEIIPYKEYNKNHPCAKWVRESSDNYNWLAKLAIALSKEYTYRTGKIHKSEVVAKWCYENQPVNNVKQILTPFTIGFNKEKYKQGYYKTIKVKPQKLGEGYYMCPCVPEIKKFIPYTWTNREKPYFMI